MRRSLGCLVVLLAVLLGAAVGVDTFARHVAEQRVAQAMRSRLAVTPQVTAHGWPFLRVLLDKHVDGADVSAPAATVSVRGTKVPVRDLVVHAHDISGATDPGTARVGSLDGHATIGYDDISAALGATIHPADAARVRLSRTVHFLGERHRAVVVGGLAVADGHLVLSRPEATLEGVPLDATTARELAVTAAQEVRMPSRAGVTITGLAAGSDGVRVDVHGTDVDLSQLR